MSTQIKEVKTGDSINGYEVLGVRHIIHGKYWSNTNIIKEFYVKAKRGQKFFSGYQYKDGRVKIDFSYSYEAPAILGDLVYYGETGTFATITAIV